MKHLGRKLLLPVAAVALAGGSFAFLASNNVATSYAGEGTGTIAGYNVTNIQYTTVAGTAAGLSADNASTFITAVSFTLDNVANPSNVRAIVHNPGNDYTYNDCTTSNGGTRFTCVQSATVNPNQNSGSPAPFDASSPTDSLTVIAAS